MPITETEPGVAETASRIGSSTRATEKSQPDPAASNGGDRLFMLIALTASVFFHAGVIAILDLLHPAVDLRAHHDPYVYVTLKSPRIGIGTSSARSSRESEQERRKDFAQISRRFTRRASALRRVPQATTKVMNEKSAVRDASRTVAATQASPALAKLDTSNTARMFLNGEREASGLRGSESSGQGSGTSVSGTVVYQPPVLLSRIIPAYPERARRLGIEGQVVLRFVVDQAGSVERDIEVISSLPMLDQAAIEAVRHWRFSPARDRNGNPVRVLVSVPLRFTLQ
jgi:protein TonB